MRGKIPLESGAPGVWRIPCRAATVTSGVNAGERPSLRAAASRQPRPGAAEHGDDLVVALALGGGDIRRLQERLGLPRVSRLPDLTPMRTGKRLTAIRASPRENAVLHAQPVVSHLRTCIGPVQGAVQEHQTIA